MALADEGRELAVTGRSASAPLGATLPDSGGRKPSGIPSAAVARNYGASVSSGFPVRQSHGGSPAPPAMSAEDPATANW